MKISAALITAVCAGCGASPSSPPPKAPPSTTATPAAPADAAIDGPALDAWLEAELAPHARAVVAGVVIGDRLVWHRGLGSRDGAGGAPPDRTSVFRIGSVTKVLTATALVQLRERGVLDLDNPVATWIPELATRLSPAGKPPVTLRHLVTHTSGIPSLGDGSAPYWGETPPTEAAMLKALDVPLQFEPGTRDEYSNAGMALAGVVVARAGKRSFRDYMASEVLRPIGMTPRWERGEVPAELRVAGQSPDGKTDPPTWQLGAFEPAGGLWASLDDLVGLARFVHGERGADEVLSAASRALMFTDDPLPGPYGVGWVSGDGGIGHTGSTTDYSATFVSIPDRRIAAIVLATGDDADLVECAAVALVRAVAGGTRPASCAAPAPTPIDRAVLAAAMDRLTAFLARPTEEAARAAFAPSFLDAIPMATLLEMSRQLAAQAGSCTGHELPATVEAAGRATLVCAKGRFALDYQLETSPPHRFTAARVIPAE